MKKYQVWLWANNGAQVLHSIHLTQGQAEAVAQEALNASPEICRIDVQERDRYFILFQLRRQSQAVANV